MAEAKISELEKVVLFWKGKEPKITKEIKFYTYDDRNPSYTEYKVWCKDDQDCWYIIVNEDNTDVKTPMVSFAGKTLSEQMWNKSTDKNYFFDVFNQYSISNTWEIKTTSLENKALDNGENIYSRWDDINQLYKKFLKDKKDISSKKEENKLRQSRIWKDKDYWNVWGYYTWFISDKVIDEKNANLWFLVIIKLKFRTLLKEYQKKRNELQDEILDVLLQLGLWFMVIKIWIDFLI